jgi:hypothetical protein
MYWNLLESPTKKLIRIFDIGTYNFSIRIFDNRTYNLSIRTYDIGTY